jgi:hypothetical protein
MLNMYKMFKGNASRIAREVVYHFPGAFTGAVVVHSVMAKYNDMKKGEIEEQKTSNKLK